MSEKHRLWTRLWTPFRKCLKTTVFAVFLSGQKCQIDPCLRLDFQKSVRNVTNKPQPTPPLTPPMTPLMAPPMTPLMTPLWPHCLHCGLIATTVASLPQNLGNISEFGNILKLRNFSEFGKYLKIEEFLRI